MKGLFKEDSYFCVFLGNYFIFLEVESYFGARIPKVEGSKSI